MSHVVVHLPTRAVAPATAGPAIASPSHLGVTLRQRLVVAVSIQEFPQLQAKFGRPAAQRLIVKFGTALAARLPGSSVIGQHDDRVLLVVPGRAGSAEARLGRARAAAAGRSVGLEQDGGGEPERLRVTPVIGYAVLRDTPAVAQRRAELALTAALQRLDLVPVAWTEELSPAPRHLWVRPVLGAAARAAWVRRLDRLRTPLQVAFTYALGLLVPYGGYVLASRLGIGHIVSSVMYALVLLALVFTACVIYVEALLALNPVRPPDEPAAPLPPASAIIAAYLPNEAATVLDTLRCFLAEADHYPTGLQVVLAYNTPERLPIESDLSNLAARDPRLVLVRVDGSTSKAQNVNAALDVVNGELVGIFDADHHPVPGSFRRAWQWLSNGYDVVQGHCVIRNGAASWVSRAVAVEFESIYAVSHPGRAKMHDFGIFGGSNGYWRTSLLREVRMRGTMLTEDIDSSMRVVLRGHRIANDPALLSRELAPTTLGALAGQRFRWAQGWFQVAIEYGGTAFRSTRLTGRQKAGTVFLLGWRELYPWLSLQIFPLVAYALLHPRQESTHWTLPLYLFTTVFTLAVSSIQAVFAYVLGAPDIRRHRLWFVSYALVIGPLYSEFKNAIARAAQLKQLLGERHWRVTARADAPSASTASPAEQAA